MANRSISSRNIPAKIDNKAAFIEDNFARETSLYRELFKQGFILKSEAIDLIYFTANNFNHWHHSRDPAQIENPDAKITLLLDTIASVREMNSDSKQTAEKYAKFHQPTSHDIKRLA